MQKIKLDDSIHLMVYNSISEMNDMIWNRFVDSFYQSHRFLELIEKTQPHILHKFVLIQENQQNIGMIYFQQLDFSVKNLIKYNDEQKDNYLKQKLKDYLQKKHLKLLNLGNVFFTGDTGIIGNYKEKILTKLPEIFTLIDKTFDKKSFGFLTSNIPLADEKQCGNFPKNGFHVLHTEPDLFLNIRPNWKSYNNYLSDFSSKYRVRAKKVMESSATIVRQEMNFDEVLLHKKTIEQLFNNVIQHAHFSMTTLDSRFFETNLQLLPEIYKVYGYFSDNKLAGFSTLYLCNKIIHVHYIGLNYEINHTHKLYNKMLLDVVKIGIEHQAERIHFGRTATEIKTTIGAEPSALNGYLKINNRLLNRIAPYFIKKISAPEFLIRKPFKE